MEKKTIAIVLPSTLPVPAICGGAIETLTTEIIEQNEKFKYYNFIVFNYEKYKNGLNKYEFKNTKIEYINYKKIYHVYDIIYLIIRKICNYKIPYKNVFLSKISKIINKRNVDSILVEGNPNYVCLLKQKTNKKIFLHIHTDHVLDQNLKNYNKVINNTEQIICVSNYIKNKIINNLNTLENQVVVCPNCVDTKKFNYDNRIKYREIMRKNLKIKEKDFVYIYIGRVEPMKGVMELVKAFKKCKVPNKKLVIVGGSNFADSKENDFIKQLENISINSNKEIILTGYICHDKLPQYYALADVFVSPSKYDEAAPLSNIEAISMGLPCILSDKGGVKEYSGINSILVNVDKNAVDNILDAMEQAYENRKNKKPYLKIQETNKWSLQEYYNNITEILKK